MSETMTVEPSTPDRTAARNELRRTRRRELVWDIGATVLTILMALAVGFVATLAVGKDPIEAFSAMLTGPFSRSIRIGRWLEDATTITLLGLSVAIPFRAGQVSLGAEGQIFIGALVAGTLSIHLAMPGLAGLLIPAAAAMLAGYVLGLLPGAMKAYWGANEIVSTLMLNAVMVRVYAWLLTSYLMADGATIVASEYLPSSSRFNPLSDLFGTDLGRANVLLFAVPVIACGVWLLLMRTPFGYEMRMVGANARFATYGGVGSRRVIAMSYAVGGAIAGLAGAHLVQGTNGRMILGISAGLGFEGIVVALLARNNPLVIPLAGLGYSYLRVGGDVMEQDASVGNEIVYIIQATVILLVTAQAAHALLRRRRHRGKADVGGVAPPTEASTAGVG